MVKTKKKSAFKQSELDKIREALPIDGMETLASQFKFATGTISNILRGQHVNDKVVLAAVELIQKHEQSISQAKEAIAEL